MPAQFKRELARDIVLLTFGLAIAGCGSPPKVDHLIDSPANGTRTQIVNARGPLSQKEAKALLAKAAKNRQESDLLRTHLLIEQEIAETPLVSGNRIKVLRDGDQTFGAMFSLIKAARHHIHLEYFIFEDVKYRGMVLSDLLIAKRKEGVTINIIYDGVGSITTPQAFFDHLKAAGVQIVEFNPISLEHASSINHRDHRKILLVDGDQAVVGGVNLSTSYESSSLRRSAGLTGDKSQYWRDTDILVQGPAVAELQKLFLQHWRQQKGPQLKDTRFFPEPRNRGDEILRVIGSAPEKELPRYYVTLLSAIRNAEKNIYLSSAYFVPTKDEKQDLIEAAKRGVDVNLFVPGISDSQASISVQRSHYDDLLEAGIKVYESRNEILHAKTVTIDDVWSVIGTSNLDHRSALLNAEVDIVVIGRSTSHELKMMFEDDIKDAHRISLEEWRCRSLLERIKDWSARFWEGML